MKESNSITRIGGRASGPPTTTPLLILLEVEEEEEEEEEEDEEIETLEELELGDNVEFPPPPPPQVFEFGDKRAGELGVRGGGLLEFKLKLFDGGIGIGIFGLGAGALHISHSCSAEWLINVQDAHSQLTSVLEEEIADEGGDDAEDKELELEPEAPPPPPPDDDVDDEAYITVDADLAAADAVDAVEAKDVAEDEAWWAAREA